MEISYFNSRIIFQSWSYQFKVDFCNMIFKLITRNKKSPAAVFILNNKIVKKKVLIHPLAVLQWFRLEIF
jgi:hypothetical protein